MPHRRAQQRERIQDALRVLLAAGGPFSAIVLRYTEISPSDLDLIFQLALMVIPPFGAWVWGLYLHSIENKVEVIAEQPPAVQREALNKVSDTAKVLIAQAVPNVATVVIKNEANGNLGDLASSEEHRDIVYESQNRIDVEAGVRATAMPIKQTETVRIDKRDNP
jgi:hypothetical protein